MPRLILPALDPRRPDSFPDPAGALSDPNGLLAHGGDLSPHRLLAAYRRGIFPWFNADLDEPILWWSPDPRCVLHTATPRANRSLRRQLRDCHWTISVDRAFRAVMQACAAPRAGQRGGSWIGPAMIDAYTTLHEQGHAHSVEVWDGARLVGGIYGVAVGRLFCGESMFSAHSGGSRIALLALAWLLRDWGWPLIDTQVANAHTLSLGAVEIARAEFLAQAHALVELPDDERWRDADLPTLAVLLSGAAA